MSQHVNVRVLVFRCRLEVNLIIENLLLLEPSNPCPSHRNEWHMMCVSSKGLAFFFFFTPEGFAGMICVSVEMS